jgi:TPR repeat protein
MVGMAGLYETGKGVPQDLDHAVEIYRQAAELGNASAIEALARLGL